MDRTITPTCICICAMVKSRSIGDGINPYYGVDDHPLLYGNNGSLDPSTYIYIYIDMLTLYKQFPIYQYVICYIFKEKKVSNGLANQMG